MIENDAQGRPFVRHFGFSLDYPVPPAEGSGAAWLNSGMDGATLGQIVPVLSEIYTVERLDREKNRIKLECVIDQELRKEIAIGAGCIAVQRDTTLQLCINGARDMSQLSITAIDGGPGANRGVPTATLGVHNSLPVSRGIATDDHITLRATVGTRVSLVQGYELTVRKIVPRDESRKIIGWVEFKADRTGGGKPN